KPQQAEYLNTLGAINTARYRRSGDLGELEEAMNAWQRAASAAPYSAQRSSYLQNVGNGWDERYQRTLDLHDLHEAVSAFEQALTETDQESQDLPGVLLNLGAERLLRYRALSDPADLESALSCCEKAANLLENREGHGSDIVALPRALTNLGVILAER